MRSPFGRRRRSGGERPRTPAAARRNKTTRPDTASDDATSPGKAPSGKASSSKARTGKTRQSPGPVPGSDEVLFVPLGGCARIGMNMSLYGHAGKWLAVDAGVAFPRDEAPGINALMPDPRFAEERADDLVGLVITHAHEDHIGAVHHLWPRLRCPIYATPFAAHVLRERFVEAGLAREVRIRIIEVGSRFRVGPFDIEAIAVTHSIPEPVSLAIRTAAGNVLHTGDWKFDPAPLVGSATDVEALRRFGDEGVLAMMCDSTNAGVDGSTGSEASARAGLAAAFAGRKGAIAVTGFASNIARLKAVAEAAAANDRRVVLAGRSLLRMEQAARATGHLDGIDEFLSVEDAAKTPRRNLVMMCTGSQGEDRAALARIAHGEHRSLTLTSGDTVIFSARAIPGNEEAIEAVKTRLARRGVEILTPADAPAGAPVHVSGHPARDDLRAMYDLVRPRVAVPVHGSLPHLEEHARLARSCGVERAMVPEDGDLIRLGGVGTAVIGNTGVGMLGHDGRALLVWRPEGQPTGEVADLQLAA